jgi:peptide deformylase
MIQPIVLYSSNHNILRTKTKKSNIQTDKENLQKLIDDMKDTLQSVGGLGLAANQLGRDESVCLVKLGDNLLTMVNPQITSRGGEKKISIEGCLSLPDITAKVERDETISVKFINPDAEWSEQEIQVDFPNSVVVQHEMDHLQGKLMTDELSPMERNLITTKLKKVSRGNANMNYVGMIWRDSQRSWSLVGPYMKLMEFYSQFQKNEETESPQVSEETTEEIKT